MSLIFNEKYVGSCDSLHALLCIAKRRKESKWRHIAFNMGLICGTTWFYSMDLGVTHWHLCQWEWPQSQGQNSPTNV